MLVTSNVMRIDPQLFRAKSLKIKFDSVLSDMLELLAKCKGYAAKCIRIFLWRKSVNLRQKYWVFAAGPANIFQKESGTTHTHESYWFWQLIACVVKGSFSLGRSHFSRSGWEVLIVGIKANWCSSKKNSKLLERFRYRLFKTHLSARTLKSITAVAVTSL